jgi:hypothetical protein
LATHRYFVKITQQTENTTRLAIDPEAFERAYKGDE